MGNGTAAPFGTINSGKMGKGGTIDLERKRGGKLSSIMPRSSAMGDLPSDLAVIDS